MIHEALKEPVVPLEDEQSSSSDSDSSTFIPTNEEKNALEFVKRSFSQALVVKNAAALEKEKRLAAPAQEGRRGRLSRNPSKLGILDELSQSSEMSYQVASDIDISSHEDQEVSTRRRVKSSSRGSKSVPSELDAKQNGKSKSRSANLSAEDYGHGSTEDNSLDGKRRGAFKRASSQQTLGFNNGTASGQKNAPPRSKSSSMALLGSSSDHTPARAATSSKSKKGKLRRRNSSMLLSAGSTHGDDSEAPEECLDEAVVDSKYKSILKKEGSPSSGNSVNFIMSGKSKKKVLRIVNYIEKFDESLRDVLWWNEDDLDRRYDQDMDMAILVEALFERVMRRAFKSTSSRNAKLEDVELDFKAMTTCSLARGMEIEVFPQIRDLKKKHRQAVLAAQDLIRDENGKISLNDSEMKLIRLQSVKYSKSFQLVALKMAQFDEIEAKQCESQDDTYGSLWQMHKRRSEK